MTESDIGFFFLGRRRGWVHGGSVSCEGMASFDLCVWVLEFQGRVLGFGSMGWSTGSFGKLNSRGEANLVVQRAKVVVLGRRRDGRGGGWDGEAYG